MSGRSAPTSASAERLTHVSLMWVEGVVEQWIRFGWATGERIVDRRRRIVSFRPGTAFAFARWRANRYGTIASRIDIVVAVGTGAPLVTVPGVDPGGDLLLHIAGWPKVERVLEAIDGVEALGIDPSDAAPDHWRHVHNRLAAGMLPRPYARDRHLAWLQRRSLQP
jgi:hypothetical protein